MEQKTPICHGMAYHIYNRGVDRRVLFFDAEDHERFLWLMEVFIVPVARVFSYAMMPEHFHLAIGVRGEDETGYLLPEHAHSKDLAVKWQTILPVDDGSDYSKMVKADPEKMLAHFFTAYAKWYNARYMRTGRLFEARYERKLIRSRRQMRTLIKYINRNPVRHGIARSVREYPWISYHALSGDVNTLVDRASVFALFEGRDGFLRAVEEEE